MVEMQPPQQQRQQQRESESPHRNYSELRTTEDKQWNTQSHTHSLATQFKTMGQVIRTALERGRKAC